MFEGYDTVHEQLLSRALVNTLIVLCCFTTPLAMLKISHNYDNTDKQDIRREESTVTAERSKVVIGL